MSSPKSTEPPQTITVTPPGGEYDSLWKIADEFFEDGSRWQSIYEANRDVLNDPNGLRAGMTLRLPMEIYPRHLRSVADAFDVERGELADAVRQAAAELNRIGDFWGTGKVATTFFKGEGDGTGYELVSGRIMEGTGALVSAHEDIPTLLRSTADGAETADWAGVAAILSALPDPDRDRPVWGESR